MSQAEVQFLYCAQPEPRLGDGFCCSSASVSSLEEQNSDAYLLPLPISL